MRRHLKNYFIPHEGNEHQPHFLRDACMGVIVAIALVVTVSSAMLLIPAIVTKFDYLATILPTILVEKTNESRAEIGENTLVFNETLAVAAQLKANDMAAKGYFAHISPDGTTPWYWIQQAGYVYTDAGENLAVNFADSNDVHNAWMNSPGHRANILRNGFTEIGIATAAGQYNGRDAIFVVQYFGKPRVIAIEVKSEIPAATNPVVTVSAATTSSPQVLGEQQLATTTAVLSAQSVGWYDRIIASPRAVMMMVLTILAGLIALALVLKVFIHRHIQFPKLILNGVLALTIIVVLLGISHMMGGLMGSVV